MRSSLVVPVEPVPNDPPRLLKRLERVLPDALLLQTPKEPFNDPVLFRRIGRNEFLVQAIVATGLPKPPTLKDQPIVAPQHRRPSRPERAEALETGRLDCPLGFLRPTP